MHISIVHGHHRMNRRLPSLFLSSRGLHFTKHQWWKLLLQKRNGFALRVEREILSRIRYQNMQRIISERWECSKVWSQCLLTKTNDFNTRNLHTLIHSYNYVYLRIYKVVQNLWYEHEFRDILWHEIRISRIIKSRGRLHELIKFENFAKLHCGKSERWNLFPWNLCFYKHWNLFNHPLKSTSCIYFRFYQLYFATRVMYTYFFFFFFWFSRSNEPLENISWKLEAIIIKHSCILISIRNYNRLNNNSSDEKRLYLR